MARADKTPLDFGLRVRTPSDGLLITAANKIRRGETVLVRFAASLVQALELFRTGTRPDQIREATKRFIATRGPWSREVRGAPSSHFVWRGTGNAPAILDYLGQYEAISTPSFNERCDALRRYIREQVEKGELMDWTVAVISKGDQEGIPKLNVSSGLSIPLVERSKTETGAWDKERFFTRALVGLLDEAVDLTAAEFDEARRKSDPDPTKPDGLPVNPGRDAIREVRSPTRGLLLIYLIHDKSVQNAVEFIPAIAVSFPESSTAKPLAYTVNDVWRQQYGLSQEDGDGDAA